MLRSTVRVAGALALIASNVLVVAGDNTTCPGDLLDWYTDIVGETPCTSTRSSTVFYVLTYGSADRHDLPTTSSAL